MDTQQVDRMNKAQYADDLDHKMSMYDAVKYSIQLCEIIIRALEPTSDDEFCAREQLISYLGLARQYALMAASDVQIEKGQLPK